MKLSFLERQLTSCFKSRFKPYSSAFESYPSLRSSFQHFFFNAGNGRLALQAFTAKSRGLDTAARMCQTELAGGVCNDSKCISTHAASFVPSGKPGFDMPVAD